MILAINYGTIDLKNEEMLYELLTQIEKLPGAYLGEPTISALASLIAGYELAFMQIKGYRLHFDRDFQKYVANYFSEERSIHWDSIISSKNEEKAIELFYQLFHEFIKQSVTNLSDGGKSENDGSVVNASV